MVFWTLRPAMEKVEQDQAMEVSHENTLLEPYPLEGNPYQNVLDIIRASLLKQGLRVETVEEDKNLQFLALSPSGKEHLGIRVELLRMSKEGLFEMEWTVKKQAALEKSCAKRQLTPVYALAFFTQEDWEHLHLLMARKETLLVLAEEKKTPWLRMDLEGNIRIRLDEKKGDLKLMADSLVVHYEHYKIRIAQA